MVDNNGQSGHPTGHSSREEKLGSASWWSRFKDFVSNIPFFVMVLVAVPLFVAVLAVIYLPAPIIGAWAIVRSFLGQHGEARALLMPMNIGALWTLVIVPRACAWLDDWVMMDEYYFMELYHDSEVREVGASEGTGRYWIWFCGAVFLVNILVSSPMTNQLTWLAIFTAITFLILWRKEKAKGLGSSGKG